MGPLVLTGFMGTGKSSVGPRVAAALGRPFLDLDALITAREGADIPTIFARWGESGFRQREAAALDEVAEQPDLVIATGGGTLLSARNRQRLAGRAVVVCLTASAEALEARLATATDRPLLQASDWRVRLRELLARREYAYRHLPNHLDTTGLTPDQVADALLVMLPQASPLLDLSPPPVTLPIEAPGGGYPIRFGSVAGIGELLAARGLHGPVAIISNPTVARFHALPLQAELAAAGLRSELIEVPDGEAYKTLATASELYDALLTQGFDRGGTVLALGGGVIGDMAGFVAATYMRGLPFVQVPTALLAMVDASVGGKVAVDHPRAKNLIGAFKQPEAVLIDSAFLATLPLRELRNGLAEVLKHGIIADPGLFALLQGWPLHALQGETTPWPPEPPGTTWPELLQRAVRVKADIVARDPFEHGERALLNLGHTFGHAYETMSGFALGHGEAISIGMVTAVKLSVALGLAPASLTGEIEAALAGLGLPVRWDGGREAETVWAVMQGDKKKASRGLRFVLPRALGDVIVTEPGAIDRALVLEVIEAHHGG